MLENTDLVFQVFQLTALIVPGPVTCGGRFTNNLDRVMICEDQVHSAILCVQDFIRSPHFTQRNFFSDSGITIVAESVAISDRITHSAVFEPWSHVETTTRSQVVADVCGCVNEALDRRRVVKDSQEQWYVVGGVKPSSGDSTSRSGVRIPNIVEEGRVEYVAVRVPSFISPGPSNLRVSSGKSKRRTMNWSPVKRRSEIASPPPASQQHRFVEDLIFKAALDHQQSCMKSRRSERKQNFQNCATDICFLIEPFQRGKDQPTETLWSAIFLLDGLLSTARLKHSAVLSDLKHLFFVVVRSVLDVGVHWIFTKVLKTYFTFDHGQPEHFLSLTKQVFFAEESRS